MAARDRDFEKQVATAFGQRLRQVRLERGLTQEQLAEAAGVHPTFVSNLERGYRVPSLATLVRLASAMEKTLADLLDGLAYRKDST